MDVYTRSHAHATKREREREREREKSSDNIVVVVIVFFFISSRCRHCRVGLLFILMEEPTLRMAFLFRQFPRSRSKIWSFPHLSACTKYKRNGFWSFFNMNYVCGVHKYFKRVIGILLHDNFIFCIGLAAIIICLIISGNSLYLKKISSLAH